MWGSYLGQVPEVVGIQQKLFKTSCIAEDVFRHCRQGAVSLIHKLDLPVAALQEWGQTLEHGAGTALALLG